MQEKQVKSEAKGFVFVLLTLPSIKDSLYSDKKEKVRPSHAILMIYCLVCVK